MRTSDFYYDLPKELIAQDPLEDRSASRLMHLDKTTGEYKHGHFRDILQYLKPGDCLVINDTKVIAARLYGSKVGTDAAIEILLLKRKENDIWETLVKPGKKCKVGTVISFGDGILTGEVVDIVDEGNRLIKFHYEGIFEEILDQLGEMPLPPYITHKLQDKNRYQTVYAKHEGSAAAPTAGLHFTKELLQQVQDAGVKIAHVTLHIFRPTAGIHRLPCGLLGYLILFDTRNFELQRKLRSSELHSKSEFFVISKHFTATPRIPPTLCVLKETSSRCSADVERLNFTTRLISGLRSI